MKTFKLDNEPKIASGFKSPENYFDNFQASMIEKLSKEPIHNEAKVVSIFRKRKTVLMAIAAVLILALMLPVLFRSATSNKELDAATIENYLADEGHINQYDLLGEMDSDRNTIISTKEIEAQTIEDMLVYNPNFENLVIENQN